MIISKLGKRDSLEKSIQDHSIVTLSNEASPDLPSNSLLTLWEHMFIDNGAGVLWVGLKAEALSAHQEDTGPRALGC